MSRKSQKRDTSSVFYQELSKIACLEDNWDGYGASGISQKVYRNAKTAAEKAIQGGLIPEISPTTAGTIEFFWSIGSVDFSMEVGSETYSVIIWKDSLLHKAMLSPVENYSELDRIWKSLNLRGIQPDNDASLGR